jgi:CheY-like chemotaxis protein
MQMSANQIVEINQQLLTLGRRGHFNVETFDPNELIEAAIRTLDIQEGILIDRQLASDLKPVSGGPAQILRVLTNLIANAIDAMGGFGTLRLETVNVHLVGALHRCSHVVEGEYVCIRVSDSGPGIPLEIQDKIFEPFFSTKKTDKKRGSGLGLSVVHAVLEDHKGYLDLESAMGQGTTFSLYIPVDHDAKALSVSADGILNGNGASVLVVDDDSIQREVVTAMLENLGYAPLALASGEQAVAHMCRNECDLVILDMVMDGIDGTETLRQIKILRPEQRALILSGFARSDRVEEAIRLGASAFVAKPVQTNVLAKAVQDALRVASLTA